MSFVGSRAGVGVTNVRGLCHGKDLFLTDSLTPPPPAWALRCHVCSSATNCEEIQTCPASSRYCKTVTTVQALTGNLVKKDCADSCTSNYSQQGQVSSGSEVTQCCQGDLCNKRLYSAAPVPALLSSATLGLAVSLGLLALTVL
ncbi:lymphocyte antigen 6D [Acomys russatus]|uniref:lymphocyte antigen 6D n=1 Tax=Acomys russatus TaxID=60746 RepID=UPI0021E29126|nr:lymphocyte antigen 6D [Acomys russatus]